MNNFNISLVIFILAMEFVSIPLSIATTLPNNNNNNNTVSGNSSSSSGSVTTTDAATSLTAAFGQPLKHENNSNMIITAKLEDPFQLAINQTSVITANNMSMQFLDVPEDSRCPAFVACIWTGQIMVSLNVSKFSSVPLILNLTLGPSPSNSSARGVDSNIIRLLHVEPYPIRDEEIAKSDYRATFLISER
jgi:hypothetical protein